MGFRFCTTPGGVATGEGAEYLISDDILSAEQARSKADRERVYRFWTQTMGTRFNDPENVGRLITAQRFDRNDLTGRMIAEEHGYETLILPIKAEPNRFWFPDRDDITTRPKDYIVPTKLQRADPKLFDNRKPGEILWPERFTEAAVNDLVKTVQGGVPGQLFQRPSIEGGSVIRSKHFQPAYLVWEDGEQWLVLGDGSPEKPAKKFKSKECFWFQTCDTASSLKESADWTVVGTFAKTPGGDLVIYHIFRERLEYPDQWPALKRLRLGTNAWDRDKAVWRFLDPHAAPKWPCEISWQGVEPKSTGEALLQAARREGVPLRRLNVEDGDKSKRAAFLVTMYESGQVYHLASGTWRPEFEDELTDFPNGAHDDQFDVAAYGAMYCVQDALTTYHGDLVLSDHGQSPATDSTVPDVFKAREQHIERSIDDLLEALNKPPRPVARKIEPDGTIHLADDDH